ncbi:MAG TPA: hypothetical protein VLB76_14155 [Thermoanaerobaculia bacterium]|nr:hypothetical protein [Thermoanaerobaculia bacterium]
MSAKPNDAMSACDPQLKTSDCLVEFFFWTGTCHVPEAELLRYGTDGNAGTLLESRLETEASKFLDHFLALRPTDSECSFKTASDRQAKIISQLIDATGQSFDPIAGEERATGLKARFGSNRIELATRKLIEASRIRMGFLANPNVPGVVKPKKLFTPEIQAILDRLEQRRKDLARNARKAPRKERDTLNCQLGELEASGELLASYSPDASAPYSGILADPTKDHCGSTTADMVKILAERNSEQGLKITNCTGATCSATVTIPPYQRATFSASVLGHHPTPRIAFNVSFFGDPEVPANSVGYVTRSDAKATDAKPKSQFNLQLGGAAMVSMDPNLTLEDGDTAVTGQIRHLGGNGSLSFQYTGPVEAGATIQFKKGDFQDNSSKQLEVSQYQAKVYGPSRVVLQYGRIPFATPSSAIAINVTGEGAQLLKDRWSLGYIVRRESETGTADRRNKDSDLWVAQFKNQTFHE